MVVIFYSAIAIIRQSTVKIKIFSVFQ